MRGVSDALVVVTPFLTRAVQAASVQHSSQLYSTFLTHMFPGSHVDPSEQHMLSLSVQ